MTIRNLVLLGKIVGLMVIAAMSLFGSVYAQPQKDSGTGNETGQPNIIFVLVDDQRFDALGFVNPKINTPNMGRMAAGGVYFKNAFVTTSLCSPSRATILTGRATRNHRIGGNAKPEPQGTTFYPALLQEQGYETALIGKWHMGHGGHPRDGFDYWLSFDGQGSYLPEQGQSGQQMFNLNGLEIPQKGYVTDELTDYFLNWLDSRENKEKPFFVHLAHKAVHSNFTPPKRHDGIYKDETFTQPMPLTPDNYENKPRWVFDQRNSWHGVDFPYYSNLDLQSFQRRYYETLLAVDDSLGRILDYLERNNLTDNTIVMLMGDNGFLFGEQGLIDKRNAYEPSIRVPLLAYAPGQLPEGVTIDSIVSNLDIAPTVLKFAGVETPSSFDGRSFVPLLKGAERNWRNELIYEYYWDVNFPQTPTTFAIRTERYKYITYHGVWDLDELYDLQNDPEERTNLINESDFTDVVTDLRTRLYAALTDSTGEYVIPYEKRHWEGVVKRNEIRTEAAPFPKSWHVAPLSDSAERRK